MDSVELHNFLVDLNSELKDALAPLPSRRELLAGMAMLGLLARGLGSDREIPHRAVRLADDLLAELELKRGR